jgi:hypothetical protein
MRVVGLKIQTWLEPVDLDCVDSAYAGAPSGTGAGETLLEMKSRKVLPPTDREATGRVDQRSAKSFEKWSKTNRPLR